MRRRFYLLLCISFFIDICAIPSAALMLPATGKASHVLIRYQSMLAKKLGDHFYPNTFLHLTIEQLRMRHDRLEKIALQHTQYAGPLEDILFEKKLIVLLTPKNKFAVVLVPKEDIDQPGLEKLYELALAIRQKVRKDAKLVAAADPTKLTFKPHITLGYINPEIAASKNFIKNWQTVQRCVQTLPHACCTFRTVCLYEGLQETRKFQLIPTD